MHETSSTLPAGPWRNWPHRSELAAFVAAVEADPDVALVLLYGSLARGDHTQRSDADVLVVAEELPPPRSRERFMQYYRHSQGKVQPLAYTIEEVRRFLGQGEPFYHEVLEEGLLLGGNKPELVEELRNVAAKAKKRLRLRRVPGGWQWGAAKT